MRLTSSGVAVVLVPVPFLVACTGPDDADLFDVDGPAGDDVSSTATAGPGMGGTSSASAGGSKDGTSMLGGETSSTTGGAPESTSGATSAATNGTGSTDGAVTGGTGGVAGTSGSADAGATGGAGARAGGGSPATSSGGSEGTSTDSGGAGSGGSAGCTPADEVCDGLDNDCNTEVDEGACPTGCVGGSFEGHAYVFCDRPAASSDMRPTRTWALAMQFCTSRGQHLAHVESEEENAFIYHALIALDSDSDAWMGATDQHQEGLWSWAARDADEGLTPFYARDEGAIDGAFNDWRAGEPNDEGGEDCGIFENRGNGAWVWDDRSCQTHFALLVCEDPG